MFYKFRKTKIKIKDIFIVLKLNETYHKFQLVLKVKKIEKILPIFLSILKSLKLVSVSTIKIHKR